MLTTIAPTQPMARLVDEDHDVCHIGGVAGRVRGTSYALDARSTMSAPPSDAPPRFALRGDLLDFTAVPRLDDVASTAVRFRPDHWLLVDGGRIVGAQPAGEPLAGDWPRHDQRGRLVLPGFVDSHVHSPQIDVIASYGSALLDWLDTHTFPAEMRYADDAESTVACQFEFQLTTHCCRWTH